MSGQVSKQDILKQLKIKQHAMTAISYMLPLVVASGLLIAIGNIAGANVIENYKEPYSIFDALVSLGVLGMGLIAPVMAAGIAFSIADRPGIAPGLLMGLIANSIGAGFFGGMLGGFLVGFFINFLKNNLKVPKWAEALMPMMILPLVSSVVIGLLMFFVVGVPIVWATEALTKTLETMGTGSKGLFGAVLGGMVAFDFGGPVNKTASLFADGLLADSIYGPEAVKVACSMVPPFGIGFAYFIRRRNFSKQEQENIKVALPLGFCMITEGVIPIAAKDPLRVVFSTTIGAAVTGAIIMMTGVESTVPSGGMFIVPALNKPLFFLLALGAGSVVTGIILSFIKKPATNDDEIDIVEEKIDLSSIKMEEL